MTFTKGIVASAPIAHRGHRDGPQTLKIQTELLSIISYQKASPRYSHTSGQTFASAGRDSTIGKANFRTYSTLALCLTPGSP